MNPDVFVQWLRGQEIRVFSSQSTYWYEVSPRILQAVPFHRQINPSQEELRKLMRNQMIIALRYSTGWNENSGAASYHVCFDKPEYTMEMLPAKARYDVRRGLKIASIEPIPFSRMAGEGWALRCETLGRQGRNRAESQKWWITLCRSAEDLPGVEAWAAMVNGKMAASLIAMTWDNCCSILYQQSRTEFLSQGVNNVLTFVFTKEVIKRSPSNWIFYGLNSLDAPDSVDAFKFRMGYTAKPVRQRVVFHPWIAPLFNQYTQKLLQRAVKLRPGNPTLSKAEGMVRFYLQGRLPIDEQPIPKALLGLFSKQEPENQ